MLVLAAFHWGPLVVGACEEGGRSGAPPVSSDEERASQPDTHKIFSGVGGWLGKTQMQKSRFCTCSQQHRGAGEGQESLNEKSGQRHCSLAAVALSNTYFLFCPDIHLIICYKFISCPLQGESVAG